MTRTFPARWILSCLLLLGASRGFSQANILRIIEGMPPDPRIEGILTKAITIELERAGLAVSDADQALVRRLNKGTADPEDYPPGSSHLLVCRYGVRNGRIDIGLTVQSLPEGAPLAREHVQRQIDLEIDSVVAGMLRNMIDRLDLRRIRTDGVDSAGAPEKTGTASATADHRSSPPQSAAPAYRRVAEQEGPSFSLQGAPVLIVGRAADYFRYAAAASAFLGYRFPFRDWNLETGLQAGYLQLFPSPDVPDGTASVITAGLSSRACTSAEAPVRIVLRIGGGAALLRVSTAAAGELSKPVAFVDGGIGVSLPVGRHLTVGPEIGSIVVFERRYPIVGITPSLAVTLHW